MYTNDSSQTDLFKQENSKPIYLTIPELANRIKASHNTIRNHITKGSLKASKPAGKYLINICDAESRYNLKLS